MLYIVAFFSTIGMKYGRFLWRETRLHILPSHATLLLHLVLQMVIASGGLYSRNK